jgi:hypothetical protein
VADTMIKATPGMPEPEITENGNWRRRPAHNRSGMTTEPPQLLDRCGYRSIAHGLMIEGL